MISEVLTVMCAVVARFTPFFFHLYADGVSESDLVTLLLAERLDFMTICKNFLPNARGWVRRVAQNHRYGVIDTDLLRI